MFYTYDILDDVLKMSDALENYLGASIRNSAVRKEFPYVNLYSDENKVFIKGIFPGLKVEDLDIELLGKSISIKGKREMKADENISFIRREREFGEFNKVIRLPYEVDREKIDANLKDGILTIELEKAEEAKPKRIEIK